MARLMVRCSRSRSRTPLYLPIRPRQLLDGSPNVAALALFLEGSLYEQSFVLGGQNTWENRASGW